MTSFSTGTFGFKSVCCSCSCQARVGDTSKFIDGRGESASFNAPPVALLLLLMMMKMMMMMMMMMMDVSVSSVALHITTTMIKLMITQHSNRPHLNYHLIGHRVLTRNQKLDSGRDGRCLQFLNGNDNRRLQARC